MSVRSWTAWELLVEFKSKAPAEERVGGGNGSDRGEKDSGGKLGQEGTGETRRQKLEC